MDDTPLPQQLAQRAEQLDSALAQALDRHDTDYEVLWDAMRYSALAPGKRIRPFLVLEFCRLLNGHDDNALPLALAVECLHVSSLIHDDLPCMDNDTMRRGRPTLHVAFDEATALLAGDALLTHAFELAAQAPLAADLTVEAVRALAGYAGVTGMMGGQMMDLQSEHIDNLELATLGKLQQLKTGRLLRLSARLGCLAAGKHPVADAPLFDAAERYADCLGTAFQIVDDLLDVTGDPSQTGKSTGQDAKNGRTTFATALGLDGAQAEATRLTQEAKQALLPFENRETLEALADYLLDRRH